MTDRVVIAWGDRLEPVAIEKDRDMTLSDADQWLLLEALDLMIVDPHRPTGAARALWNRIAYGDKG